MFLKGKHRGWYWLTGLRCKSREIYVDGEIFIDVKKDTEKPFIVKTSGFDIRVTGTAFNVDAYKAMREAEVVLVRGSIIVKDHANKETAVKPNELLKLSEGVANVKRSVNAEEYTAWTKGHFPLEGKEFQKYTLSVSVQLLMDIICLLTEILIFKNTRCL